MLIINKILSKKIQFSLSLRAKRRGNLNINGFTLIELMVAVVILAIALVGIFLAFSSGWMGMADARDRTVATNYAQEILEDIKNTPFEKIHSEFAQIGDTKFYRSISLNPIINPNIKEVTAQVTWTNWRGSVKNVTASTLIYSQISSEPTSEAVALALYAEPYYNILPGSSSTMLTVLVQDANGNLVTDGEKVIDFSVGDPLLGNVLPSSITTQNGKATVFFASSGVFGSAEIEASSPGLTSDSVTFLITDAAVAIKLEANPATISTGGQSVINVSLLDASYINPPVSIDEHLVTLYVNEGPGTITPISVLLNDDNDTASIVLTSSGTPGVVTIVASCIDLDSALVNVPILGAADSISITAIPGSINLSENTEITVTIKDSAGNPVIYSGSINLSLSISNGSLSGEDYDGGVLTFLDESSKSITYAPSDAGEVDITATSDVEGELFPDTVTVYISEGRKIELTAVPDNIIADGNDSSTITATVKDMDGDIVTDEDYQIVFEILSGNGSLSDIIKTTENGVATTILTSTSELDLITVIARGMDLTSDSVTVQTTIPKFISISADKDWLYEGDEAVISINVVDGVGYPVEDYFGSINLILSDYGLGSIFPDTLIYPGEVIANFTALSTGEVTITADGEGINLDSITMQILEEGEITLTLADNITTSDGGKTISFDISNDGVVGLEIVQMQVIWNSLSSTLAQVQARAPSASDPVVVYNGPAVGSGTLIDIDSTTLPSGISTISLYFSGDMNGKTITVLFFDNNLQYGPIEFTVIP